MARLPKPPPSRAALSFARRDRGARLRDVSSAPRTATAPPTTTPPRRATAVSSSFAEELERRRSAKTSGGGGGEEREAWGDKWGPRRRRRRSRRRSPVRQGRRRARRRDGAAAAQPCVTERRPGGLPHARGGASQARICLIHLLRPAHRRLLCPVRQHVCALGEQISFDGGDAYGAPHHTMPPEGPPRRTHRRSNGAHVRSHPLRTVTEADLRQHLIEEGQIVARTRGPRRERVQKKVAL